MSDGRIKGDPGLRSECAILKKWIESDDRLVSRDEASRKIKSHEFDQEGAEYGGTKTVEKTAWWMRKGYVDTAILIRGFRHNNSRLRHGF